MIFVTFLTRLYNLSGVATFLQATYAECIANDYGLLPTFIIFGNASKACPLIKSNTRNVTIIDPHQRLSQQHT
jgi:hypothetical protein